MEIYSKTPDLSGQKTKFLFFLFISLSFLFLGMFFNENKPYFKENSFPQEGLVLLNGNALMPVSSLPNSDPKIVKKFPVIVTAYSSTPWETWGNPYLTASGSWVRDGIIANNLLPFGTRIRMPEIYGDKVFVVEDRMNSRKGDYHFDVWFPSYWQAKEFGAKKTYIEILEG